MYNAFWINFSIRLVCVKLWDLWPKNVFIYVSVIFLQAIWLDSNIWPYPLAIITVMSYTLPLYFLIWRLKEYQITDIIWFYNAKKIEHYKQLNNAQQLDVIRTNQLYLLHVYTNIVYLYPITIIPVFPIDKKWRFPQFKATESPKKWSVKITVT